jgi:hypothetical protein
VDTRGITVQLWKALDIAELLQDGDGIVTARTAA